MFVDIKDDFDLDKIIDSGQCFRPKYCAEIKKYRFICSDRVLYIGKTDEPQRFEISCDEQEWNSCWKEYFDLETDYSKIREYIENRPDAYAYLREAASYAEGIRILKQDYWETLVSFIISQRKSIPAIRSSVEKLCKAFGKIKITEYEKVYMFPKASDMICADANILSECGLGYRVPYILEAVKAVNEAGLCLEELGNLSNGELFERLCLMKGVGKKVADCVMLFAYHRTDRAPVDVWIRRVIEERFEGVNVFEDFGDYAGIVQQYVFYYARCKAAIGNI